MSKDLEFSYYHPTNPLPFEIVGETCGDCVEAIKELNRFLSYSRVDDKVILLLNKDSAGRGWHIQGYQLSDKEYVDLSGRGILVRREQ